MLTTLRLRPAHEVVRDAIAWFLPGDDVVAWLDEVATWSVPMESVVFYLIADAAGSGLAGTLAIPPAGTRVTSGGRAQPYGCAAAGIFLPVDAHLWPPVGGEELRAATPFPVLFFHPAFGLTGGEERDGQRAWELLLAPPLADEDWGLARAGPPRAAGLRAVRLMAEISIQEIFGEESADIGRDAPEELPPVPDEPDERIPSRITRSMSEALAKALIGLTSRLPHTASAPTWINALENWAQRKAAGVARDLDRLRHRELHRLVRLLESNPEEGLRHAISLADLAHRGRAAPTGRLGRRDSLDFNLGRLGGAGAADFWSIPEELRSSLAKRYRESAMRELKLGRHRRAACIFAELLGDFASAADALKQGRHFREAALVYRERLNNPLAAASCLADGGLFVEAIALYEQHERWIEVADLHGKTGDRAAELAAVRRAVGKFTADGDALGAARLIDSRLDEPDEAAALLASTWPNGRQAVAALEERFALLKRRQRPEAACALLAKLGQESTPVSLVRDLTGVLAKAAEEASDSRVRRAAADVTRIKAASVLAERALDRSDEMAVLRALTRVTPGDRLLVRDVQRFREGRPKPVVAPRPAATAVTRRIVPEKQSTLDLPSHVRWARFHGDSAGFCAVGTTADKTVFFIRSSWTQGKQVREWPDPSADRGRHFLLAPYVRSIVIARPFAERLEMRSLPPADSFGGFGCDVGTPAWLPNDAVQLAVSRFTLWAVRVVDSRIVLAAFENERLVGSRDVTDELIAAGATGAGTSLALEAQQGAGRVALGYGKHLLVQDNGRELRIIDMGMRVTGLIAARGVAAGWIVLLERGAEFVSADTSKRFPLDDQIVAPRGTFLQDGRLVLIGDTEGIVTRVEPERAVREAWFQLEGGAGIEVTATPHPREIAVFTADGFVQRWQLPV